MTKPRLTNDKIITAHKDFNVNGYTAEWLSFKGDIHFSLGTFRDKMIRENPNFFIVPKNKGKYTGLWIEDISNWIEKTQKEYYKFCCEMDITCENKKETIFNWYRGAIGEWFLTRVLLNTYSINVSENGIVHTYRFLNPIPTYTITGQKYEYGTDALAIGPDNISVAIQIKFWNLFTNQQIDYGTVFSHLQSDALENSYVENDDTKPTLWIIWTGLKDEYKDISNWLRQHSAYKEGRLKFIDRNDMNRSMENNENIHTIWQQEVNNWK